MCSGRQQRLSQHCSCAVVTVWLQLESTFPVLPPSSVGVDRNIYQLLYRKYDTLRWGGGGVTIFLFFFIKRPGGKDILCENLSPEGISGVALLLTIALSTILVRWHVCHHDPRIASQVGKLSIGKRKGHHRIGFWHFQLPWHGSGLPACGMCLSYRTYRSELRSFRLCVLL